MKNWVRLSVLGIVVLCFLFSGCAAGKVYMARSGDDQASCSELEQGLELAQSQMETLKETDHTRRNVRDVVFGAAGFIFPPMGILNAILMVSDSHVADLAETEALEERYNGMVSLSNQKECGYVYAMIPPSN